VLPELTNADVVSGCNNSLPLHRASEDPGVWQSFLEHAPDGIIVLDTSLNVVLFNRKASRLWQLPVSQAIGQHIHALLKGCVCNQLLIDLDTPTRLGTETRYLVQFDADAVHRSLAISVAVVSNAGGDQYMMTARDVTSLVNQQLHSQRISLALDHSDNAIILCGRSGLIDYVNEGFLTMFGHRTEEAIGASPIQLLSGPQSDEHTLSKITEQHFARQSHQAEVLAYRQDGSPLWTSVNATPITLEDDRTDGSIIVLNDITAFKTHELLHDKVLDALVRDVPLGDTMLLICQELERVAPDLVVSITRISPANTLQFLASPNLPAPYIASLEGSALGPGAAPCGVVAARGRPLRIPSIANDPALASRRDLILTAGLLSCWSQPIRTTSGQTLGALSFYYRHEREPTRWHQQLAELSLHLCALALERDATRARMHQLAFYDALTGLPNRMMFNARAEQLMADASQETRSMALLFIDLDRFKRINETQGHAAADGVLRDLSQRIRQVAGDDALLGRQLSDEFILLLPHCTTEQAASICEHLRKAIAAPLVAGHMSVHASASIGVAMYPDDGRDIDTLLRQADMAMHQCKHNGGDGFHFFSHDMNRIAQERAALETALHDAMQHDQLQLHYQPQLCGQTGKLWGVEALLRWTHPQLGPISPARFIPMAEESGLINELSNWVLRRACRDLAYWRQIKFDIPRVSVNLSASSFDDVEFPRQLGRLLDQHGLTPSDLILEITESVMLSPHPRVLENLDAIRSMGLGLSLDDFGTGYSSLSHLHQLPISELKLDRSFVKDIEHSESARSLITSVLRIGENLRKDVVAEGVETEGQRRFLTEQGCQLLQGFLFSPGLPIGALEQWLRSHTEALQATQTI
jgi:diguanylate cyclase (GGDEF)-like protein/PAS domain S-box-containing protein